MKDLEKSPASELRPPSLFLLLGAVFEGGLLASYSYDWVRKEYTVPLLDPTKREERRRYWMENIRVFSDGTLPNPTATWKNFVDNLVMDLKVACQRAKLPTREIREAELDLKAVMAISASARAMEQSAGDLNKYILFITDGGDLDRQDTWAEFLLHNDPGKIERVLTDPLVMHYFERLLQDAGITNFQKWGRNRPSSWELDREAAIKGRLIEYLRKGGFNEYITDVLLGEDPQPFIEQQLALGLGDTCRWAAARLACDIFLVDLYARWEFEVDPNGELNLKPSPDWGGNPLRFVLDPSFLPRIKRVYRGEHSSVLDLLDKTLRPNDVFEESGLVSAMVFPSMVENLKRLQRLYTALSLLLGGSQAPSLPKWTEKELGEITVIADEINQLYGSIATPEDPNIGKKICGIMMARIILLKALAAALEIREGGKVSQFLGHEEKRPFYKILVNLWGEDRRARTGILASLAGGRLGFIFRGNPKAEKALNEAFKILYTADASPKRKRTWRVGRGVEFFLNAAEILSKIQEVWT